MLVCSTKATLTGDTHLFSDVQAEAVTISVVQLLRKVVWRLLSAHVVNGPAQNNINA